MNEPDEYNLQTDITQEDLEKKFGKLKEVPMTKSVEELPAVFSKEAVSQPGGVKVIEKLDVFQGIATLEITEEQQRQLSEPVPLEEIDIKPTGQIYFSHIFVRKHLNKIFGAGKWGMIPNSPVKIHGNLVLREYVLYVSGKPVSSAIGEQQYIESNAQMTYGDAIESTKSNALIRCCKDLGIASECWQKEFVENFKKVYCETYQQLDRRTNQNKTYWRKKKVVPGVNMDTGEVTQEEIDALEARNPAVGDNTPLEARNTPAQSPAVAPKNPKAGITKAQEKLIYAKCKAKNKSIDELKKVFNLQHLSDIEMGDMNNILAWIDN